MSFTTCIPCANTCMPSLPYQFSRWYELEGNEGVKGSHLHSPRIREGPSNVTSLYASHTVMYCKKSHDWKDFRNSAEDWENAQVREMFVVKEKKKL